MTAYGPAACTPNITPVSTRREAAHQHAAARQQAAIAEAV
jgi:hypothetical protein